MDSRIPVRSWILVFQSASFDSSVDVGIVVSVCILDL